MSAPPRRPASPLRLWPLLLIPLLGLTAGLVRGWLSGRATGADLSDFDLALSGAYGLAGGSGVMMLAAATVLAVRVARRRFTLRALMAVVAATALFLVLVRACRP